MSGFQDASQMGGRQQHERGPRYAGGIETDQRRVVERYFQAMRAGAADLEALLDLFADEAVYSEPFSGTSTTHRGKAAIRRSYQASQPNAPPDMTLSLDRVEIDGERVRTEWTCNAPSFPHPMRGRDDWLIREGKIHALETRFL